MSAEKWQAKAVPFGNAFAQIHCRKQGRTNANALLFHESQLPPSHFNVFILLILILGQVQVSYPVQEMQAGNIMSAQKVIKL